jgi:hypothetical protein
LDRQGASPGSRRGMTTACIRGSCRPRTPVYTSLQCELEATLSALRLPTWAGIFLPPKPEPRPSRASQAGGRTRTIPCQVAQRASVGSTEASDGRLARVGRIDRSTCGVFSRLDATLYACHPRCVIAYLEPGGLVIRLCKAVALAGPGNLGPAGADSA